MGCGKRGEVLSCAGTGDGGYDDDDDTVEHRVVRTEGG